MITADHVRELVDAPFPDAVLVLVEGRVEVVPASALAQADHAGALIVAARDDLTESGELRELGQRELEEAAARFDAQVAELGG